MHIGPIAIERTLVTGGAHMEFIEAVYQQKLLSISRMILVLIFGVSTVNKVLNFRKFQDSIMRWGHVPTSLVLPSSVAIFILEALTLLLLLLANEYLEVALLLSITTLILFTIYLFTMLQRSENEICNCFILRTGHISSLTIYRNAVFVFVALVGLTLSPAAATPFGVGDMGTQIGTLIPALLVTSFLVFLDDVIPLISGR